METAIVTENKLEALVKESGLDETKSQFILRQFSGFFDIAADWERKSRAIVVTSETQTAEMKMAREGRLFLRQKRIEIERARKELKEQSLREGRTIDGIANVLKGILEPTEEYLEQQERFVEIQDAKRRDALAVERSAVLQSLEVDPTFYDLKNMPDAQWDTLLSSSKLAKTQREEAAKKAEEERIAKEAEDRRVRDENARLKQEAEEKERKAAEERKEAERKLKAERDAREKLERETKERLAKEEAERKRKAAEERKAKNAPDRDKLLAWAQALNQLSTPVVKSEEAGAIVSNARTRIAGAIAYLKQEAENL